jgi:hypothetical protein
VALYVLQKTNSSTKLIIHPQIPLAQNGAMTHNPPPAWPDDGGSCCCFCSASFSIYDKLCHGELSYTFFSPQESLVLEDKPDLQKMYTSINGILASVLKICNDLNNDLKMAAPQKRQYIVVG